MRAAVWTFNSGILLFVLSLSLLGCAGPDEQQKQGGMVKPGGGSSASGSSGPAKAGKEEEGEKLSNSANSAGCTGKSTSGEFSGSLKGPDDFKEMTVPPQGPDVGFFTVSFSVEKIEPKFALHVENESFTTFGQKNQPLNYTWISEPGQAYPFKFTQKTTVDPLKYPLGYTLTWSWAPGPDCSEPNNGLDEALPITLGKEHSSWLHVGVSPERAYGRVDDYWQVESKEKGKLKASYSGPSNIAVDLAIYDASGKFLASARGKEVGKAVQVETPEEVEPGRYAIAVVPSQLDYRQVHMPQRSPEDEEAPAHFNQPYTLKVEMVSE